MPQGFAIAIDGPVASGKGTIASQLAKDIHALYLYTGAMYRSVALLCIERGLDVTDPEQVIKVLGHFDFGIDNGTILLNGRDVTDRIKEPDTASGASVVAVIPHVRKVLVKRQQEIAQEAINKGMIVVSEGRDTGTVVFPDAAIKIYLTASPEVRAQRRQKQYTGQDKPFSEVLQSVKERDERDTGRKTDPLPANPEALGFFVLDNSHMSEEQTLEAIKQELRKRKLI